MRKYIAEAIGTFALVFAGTGALVINKVSNGTVTSPGIAITFGLVVMAMIYAFGETSGAHLNPAVTAGFFLARRFPGRSAIATVVSSRTTTEPGSSPRGETSQSPWSEAVARKTIGDAAIHCLWTSSSR